MSTTTTSSGVGGVPQPPPRTGRQEVAPKGGYSHINVARNVPSTIGRSAGPIFFGTAAFMMWGMYRIGQFNILRRQLKQEKRDVRMAITPLLQAEEDARFVVSRTDYLKWEAELMKDVPGWIVGENVYKTRSFMAPPGKGPMFEHD